MELKVGPGQGQGDHSIGLGSDAKRRSQKKIWSGSLRELPLVRTRNKSCQIRERLYGSRRRSVTGIKQSKLY